MAVTNYLFATIAAAIANGTIPAVVKQLKNAANLQGTPYINGSEAFPGATLASLTANVKYLLEADSIITDKFAKMNCEEAYALLISAQTILPT